jgi:hypothetical protein
MNTKTLLSGSLTFAILLVIGLTFTTCKEDDSDQEPDGNVIIPSTTKIISDDNFLNYMVSYDSAEYFLVFAKDLLNEIKLNVGDVIVSTYGDGMLRKVTAINETSNEVSIETEFASITEALTKGEISFYDELPPYMVSESRAFVEGITDRTNYLKDSEDQNYHLVLNFVLYDLDENLATEHDQIRITGDFEMNPAITVVGQIENGNLEYLKAEFSFDESLSLTAVSKLLTQLQLDKIVFTYRFPTQIGFAGGLPYTYQPIIEIHAGVILNSNCQAEIGFSQGFTQTAGLLYENSDWTTYKTSQNTFEWELPSINNSISIQPYLKPELGLKLYGILSPYVKAKGYGNLEAEVGGIPWWELSLGYNVSIGAEMKIWKKTFLDIERIVLENEWKVAEAQSTNQAPNHPSNPSPTDNATDVNTSTALSWTCTDPDQDPISYNVYFGASNNPSLVTSNITSNTLTLNLLSPNTTYYWKIVANDDHSNSTEGDIWKFTTGNGGITIPTVVTAAVANPTQTSVTCGGNVTSNGGATVTARGVCWSEESLPDLEDLYTSDGSGTGEFTSEISGLTPNATYHVRAYATNSEGAAYGDDIEFTTEGGATGDLVAYYPFNGNYDDVSGNGNSGINNGAILIQDRFGFADRALSLEGSADYVEIPNSPSLNITSDLSICFWLKKGTSNIPSMCVPLSKRNPTDSELHYTIVLKSTDGVTFQFSGAGAPSPYYEVFYSEGDVYNLLNDGNWHYVVICHTYGTGINDKIYIDNVLYSISYSGWWTSFNYPAVPSNSTLVFGCQQSSAQFPYNGLLDDVRIYNKLLTESDINTLYHEGGW